MIRLGVLALQGSFAEHLRMLARFPQVEAVAVRTARELETVQGLILPGGESTALRRLMAPENLTERIRQSIRQGMPVWGTCAGMILLAGTVEGESPHLGVMDVTVSRNAYGTQRDSFSAPGRWVLGEEGTSEMIFIRAPRFLVLGPRARPAAFLGDTAVAAVQGRLLATAFHPELTGDETPYRWLMDRVEGQG